MPELSALWSATKPRPNPGGLEQVWLDFLRGHGAAATEWIGWMKVGGPLACEVLDRRSDALCRIWDLHYKSLWTTIPP